MMIAAAALALGWATAAWADDWGEVAQVSATMGVHDGRICLGEGSRGDLGCPSYAPQVMSSGLLSATNVSATGAVQAVRFIGDGSSLTNLMGSDRIVSGTSSVTASQDRSVTLATAGSTRVIVGENGYVGLGNFIGANPTSELHIVSSRTSGLAPYMLLQAGKAQYSAAAVALQRAASTQQMLIGFETGSSSQPDGYIGTLANKPRAIYVHTGQGLSNQTAVGIEGEGSTAGLRIGTGTNIDSGRPGAIISSSGIAFFGGNAGEPSVTMHVSGTVRIADGGEPCDSNRRGAIRYTSATTFDFCDGVNGWRSLAATATNGGDDDRIVSGTSNVVATQDRSVTISTAGSARVLVGENGRVGIGTGTAAPSATLQVSGTAIFGTSTPGSVGGMVDVRTGRVSSSALAVTGNNYGEMLKMWVDDATSYIQTGQDEFAAGDTNFAHMALVLGNKTQFNPIFGVYNGTTGSNVALLRVLYDGRAALGYGAFVPSTTLQVKGSLRFGEETSGTLAVCDADRAGAMRYTSASTFDFCDGVGGWRSLAAMASAGGVTTDRVVSGTSNVIAAQSASVTISTAGTQRMVVGQNGRIGIGTTQPAVGLHISDTTVRIGGNGGFLHLYPDTTDNNLAKLALHPTHTNLASQYFAGIAYSNSGGWVSVGGGTLLNLYLDSGSAASYGSHIFRKLSWDGTQKVYTEKMRLDVNGNLGIGTTMPSKTLTVNGDAAVSGTVQVAGTGAETCAPGLRGTIRQNPVTKKLEVCRY